MDTEEPQHAGAGLSFRLDSEVRALIASFIPSPAGTSIDEAWLDAKLGELGYGDLHFLPSAKTVLLGHYNSGQPIDALRIAECVDATLSITIASDRMSALLDINPAQGGARVTRDEVLAELADKGVTQGILQQAIDQAIVDGAAQRVVVAQGRAAVAGLNGRFESLVPDVRDRVPRVDETGHTDYRDLGDILVVHPGDALMMRHHATEGTAGTTLFGDPVPASAGEDVVYASNLTGVAFAQDNPDMLVAAIVGQPVQVAGGMIVEPVYSVDAVSMASGNISFDGSVKVRGDVSAGMRVQAAGDIEIGGVAEPCILEGGGNITIKGGVMGAAGRKDGADYHIRCGGSFAAGYAQQVRVEAGDSIFIDDMAMQCELTATNHVQVGNKKRGHIVGGRVQAMLSITAKVLGSPNRVATQLEIGVNPEVQKQAQELARNRDGKENRLLELSKLLAFAAANPGRVNPDMIERARATAASISAEIQSLRDEEEIIARKIELSHDARVKVEQAMYEGVIVYMGTQRYRVVGERGGGSIGLGKHGLGLLSEK
jgi:uncharacterized protein